LLGSPRTDGKFNEVGGKLKERIKGGDLLRKNGSNISNSANNNGKVKKEKFKKVAKERRGKK
jgi:hypothetical protein